MPTSHESIWSHPSSDEGLEAQPEFGAIRQRIGSKHPNGISGPLKTRLSNSKRIYALPYTTEVNINPQVSNVIVQLRRPRSAQNLTTRFCQETHIVGPFFASDRKFKDQVLSCSRDLQRCTLRWRFPTGYRALPKVQNRCVSRRYRVASSHPPQRSPDCEKQNGSSGHQSHHTSALACRLPAKLFEFLEARTA